jgi:hypothetical protein
MYGNERKYIRCAAFVWQENQPFRKDVLRVLQNGENPPASQTRL